MSWNGPFLNMDACEDLSLHCFPCQVNSLEKQLEKIKQELLDQKNAHAEALQKAEISESKAQAKQKEVEAWQKQVDSALPQSCLHVILKRKTCCYRILRLALLGKQPLRGGEAFEFGHHVNRETLVSLPTKLHGKFCDRGQI